MKWTDVHPHLVRLIEGASAQGVTQAQIAARGGLHGPNAISKLLAKKRGHGPTVDTLLGAIEGLGLSVSEVFAALEPHVETRTEARLRQIERMLRLRRSR